MNYEARPINKGHNPQHHWPSLKNIALAATIAVLFCSIQANAYPLHKGDYLFWPEMPAAAQVLADMKGTNNLDTAAQQHAALVILVRLVDVEAAGTGKIPRTPREQELNQAYLRARPDGDGQHDAMLAESARLQADTTFVQTFLNRYFSAAAVREIEPLVPGLEAQARPGSAYVQTPAANGQGKIASSLHNGDYLFWPQMPSAARVLADMKGANDFDTAVQQRAALDLLRDLVRADIDRTGSPWSAQQEGLDSAYMHALAGVNGNTYEIKEAALRLQANPSFIEPFLKRYFSEAAVREIEPMVPDFETNAVKDVAEVQAFEKRDAPRLNAEANAAKIALALRGGLTQAQFDYFVDGVMALGLIFIIIWLVKLYHCLPIGMTSDDPPQFKGWLSSRKVYTFTGHVRGSAIRSDTSVSGSISTAGNRVYGSISSKTTVTDTFRLVDPRTKQEENFAVQNFHVRIFEDQLVSVAWFIRKNRKNGPVFIVVNHTTDECFIPHTAVWHKVGILDSIFIFGITIIIGMFCYPVWLFPIVWIILLKIQIKRFRNSGVQPLVKALNRKAEDLS